MSKLHRNLPLDSHDQQALSSSIPNHIAIRAEDMEFLEGQINSLGNEVILAMARRYFKSDEVRAMHVIEGFVAAAGGLEEVRQNISDTTNTVRARVAAELLMMWALIWDKSWMDRAKKEQAWNDARPGKALFPLPLNEMPDICRYYCCKDGPST
jgi:hypothetical protein